MKITALDLNLEELDLSEGSPMYDMLRDAFARAAAAPKPPRPRGPDGKFLKTNTHPPCSDPGCFDHGIAASNRRQSEFYARNDRTIDARGDDD